MFFHSWAAMRPLGRPREALERLECQQACFTWLPKQDPKTSASQICLQNLCGQQQNSPIADSTFGSKSGSTLIFLLDMVLPQLDAYHSGRQLQHLQPWVSVELAQQLDRGQPGVRLNVTYQYEAYASFHVIQLHTEGAPILLFSDPMAIPQL